MSSTDNRPKAERVFDMFGAVFGVQKTLSIFDGMNADQQANARALWSRQLDRFSGQTIAKAMQALVDSGAKWPPSMGEFVLLCKQHTVAPEHRLALPLPKKTDAELADGKRRVAEMLAALADKKRVRA